VRLDVNRCSSLKQTGGRELKRIVLDEGRSPSECRAWAGKSRRPYPDRDLLGPGPSQGQLHLLEAISSGDHGRCRSIFSSRRATAKNGVERNVRLVYDPETELAGSTSCWRTSSTPARPEQAGRAAAAAAAASLEICALLHNMSLNIWSWRRNSGFDPRRCSWSAMPRHAENFRHLPYIASLT